MSSVIAECFRAHEIKFGDLIMGNTIKSLYLKSCTSWVAAIMLGFILYGCAGSLHTSKQDIQRLEPTEGIVIGSVLVRIGLEPLEEPQKEFLLQALLDAKELPYELRVWEVGKLIITRKLAVVADEEEFFVGKFDEGEYSFSVLGVPAMSHLDMQTGIRFTVTPGKTTYIGRLFFYLQEHFYTSFVYKVWVEDTQDATIASLQNEYGEILEHVNKRLMKVQSKCELYRQRRYTDICIK